MTRTVHAYSFALIIGWLVAVPGGVVATESLLESIDSTEAPGLVRASRGLVFVDLYADW